MIDGHGSGIGGAVTSMTDWVSSAKARRVPGAPRRARRRAGRGRRSSRRRGRSRVAEVARDRAVRAEALLLDPLDVAVGIVVEHERDERDAMLNGGRELVAENRNPPSPATTGPSGGKAAWRRAGRKTGAERSRLTGREEVRGPLNGNARWAAKPIWVTSSTRIASSGSTSWIASRWTSCGRGGRRGDERGPDRRAPRAVRPPDLAREGLDQGGAGLACVGVDADRRRRVGRARLRPCRLVIDSTRRSPVQQGELDPRADADHDVGVGQRRTRPPRARAAGGRSRSPRGPSGVSTRAPAATSPGRRPRAGVQRAAADQDQWARGGRAPPSAACSITAGSGLGIVLAFLPRLSRALAAPPEINRNFDHDGARGVSETSASNTAWIWRAARVHVGRTMPTCFVTCASTPGWSSSSCSTPSVALARVRNVDLTDDRHPRRRRTRC